jgi:hypothetical protein
LWWFILANNIEIEIIRMMIFIIFLLFFCFGVVV